MRHFVCNKSLILCSVNSSSSVHDQYLLFLHMCWLQEGIDGFKVITGVFHKFSAIQECQHCQLC